MEKKSKNRKNKIKLPPLKSKRAVGLIIAVVIGGLFIGFVVCSVIQGLFTKESQQLVSALNKNEVRSRMYFDPVLQKAGVGETVSVTIVLDAPGKTVNALDAILTFDRQVLEFVDAEKPENSPETLTLLRSIAEDNSIIVTLANFQPETISFTNTPVIKVIFRAVSTGTSGLSLKLNPGETTGSTVIESATNENILDKVDNATITVE